MKIVIVAITQTVTSLVWSPVLPGTSKNGLRYWGLEIILGKKKDNSDTVI